MERKKTDHVYHKVLSVWGIHLTKWRGTRSLLLFSALHKVGFFRISLFIPNGIYSMEFIQIKCRVRWKSSSFWWCKRYSVNWSNSWEHSKKVFAVNLGYQDNVNKFWWKTFSECSRESDQIAKKRLYQQKELDFPRTLRFIWTNSIGYKSRYSKKSYLMQSYK